VKENILNLIEGKNKVKEDIEKSCSSHLINPINSIAFTIASIIALNSTPANADSLSIKVNPNKTELLYGVDYKNYNYPENRVNKVCDRNGNKNGKIDTDTEYDCVDNAENFYDNRYNQRQNEIVEENYVIAGALALDTKSNMERAKKLEQEILLLKAELAKLKKDNANLTVEERSIKEHNRELTEEIKKIEEDIRAKEEIIKSIQFFA